MAKCKTLVRNPETGLDPEPCGTELVSNNSPCPNRLNHVNQYRTGFCIDKHCEGTEHKTNSGSYQKTCTFWLTCPCSCHVTISELYKLAKEPRKIPFQKYEPPHNDFVMPDRAEVLQELAQRDNPNVTIIKSDNDQVPDRIVRHGEPPQPGKSRRGQLEELVRECLDAWITSGQHDKATTGYVSEWIAKKYSIQAPSRGAIDSIYKRWEEVGFAVIAPKPNRFVGYTPQGKARGLLALKQEQKRTTKYALAK